MSEDSGFHLTSNTRHLTGSGVGQVLVRETAGGSKETTNPEQCLLLRGHRMGAQEVMNTEPTQNTAFGGENDSCSLSFCGQTSFFGPPVQV